MYKLQKRFRQCFTEQEQTLEKNNFIIEFMGPPGVGKTTYAKTLAKNLRSSSELITNTEIKVLLGTNLRNYIIFNDYHTVLFSDFMSYMALAKDHIKNKVKTVRFGLSELECDAMAAHFNGIVINDEGISHHFTELLIKNISSEGFNKVNNFFRNRLIVYLDESKEVVLSRVKQRLYKDNNLWDGHKGLSDTEIMELTEKDIQIKKKLCEMVSAVDEHAIVILDSQSSIGDNMKIIQNIIKV